MDTGIARPVLLDNTVLTNFALVGEARLVEHLWATRACTTPATLGEYEAGAASGVVPAGHWANLPLVTLTKQELAFAGGLSLRLGAGERTCVAVAFHRQGLLASDDLDARRVAEGYGIPVTGTVGILVLCVQRQRLSRHRAEALLQDMIARGYRSPVTGLGDLLGSL
jgi:predicted nucleic acid-binding protein